MHRHAASPRAAARTAIAVALVALAGSCSDGETAATTSAAPSSTEGSPTSGASLYVASCGACHGDDLRGTDKGPSHLSIVYEPNHHPDESFRSAIQNGVQAHHWQLGDMPPVPDLDAAEVTAIIDYVRAQQEEHGFEDYPPS